MKCTGELSSNELSDGYGKAKLNAVVNSAMKTRTRTKHKISTDRINHGALSKPGCIVALICWNCEM